MKDEFIVQSYGTDTVTIDLLFMFGVSFSTLALCNKIVFYCNDDVYDVIKHLKLPANVEIVNDLNAKNLDSTPKFEMYKKLIDEPFIHVDSDFFYEGKISFKGNELIYHNVSNYGKIENYQWYDTFTTHYKNLLKDYPVKTLNGDIEIHGHGVFGCKNKNLLEEQLENVKLHVEANKDKLKNSLRHDANMFYVTLEEHHFHTISHKYNLPTTIFERDYPDLDRFNYYHIGNRKKARVHRENTKNKLKLYNLNLYNQILNIGYDTNFLDTIKKRQFRIRVNHNPQYNCWHSKWNWKISINYNEMYSDSIKCVWYFNNLNFEDNTEFKIAEDDNWNGYFLGMQTLDITCYNGAEIKEQIIHDHDNYSLAHDGVFLKDKGLYDFKLTYSVEDYTFKLDIIKK